MVKRKYISDDAQKIYEEWEQYKKQHGIKSENGIFNWMLVFLILDATFIIVALYIFFAYPEYFVW